LLKNKYIAVAAAVVAVGGAGATAVASMADAATAHKASAAALKLGSVSISGHGKHSLLETSSGRAVYLLTGDSTKHPLCATAACLGIWPAVTTSSKNPVLGSGIMGKLTVWTHGKRHQLVLNGHPLYTFVKDSSANSAAGQGVKDGSSTWELLTASATGYTVSSSSSSSSSGTTSGGTTTSGTTSTSPSGSWS
jgi:predicted lipoprotein with Yx(FWY)xxD motif